MSYVNSHGDLGFTENPETGELILKNELIIEVIGSIEELEADLAILHAKGKKAISESTLINIIKTLSKIKHNDIVNPVNLNYEDNLELMESVINYIKQNTISFEKKPLFIGSELVTQIYKTMTTSKRVERLLVSYNIKTKKHEKIIQFLNRLSKYLFMLGQYHS
jgi:cob(I)alamin adenosyltransferase